MDKPSPGILTSIFRGFRLFFHLAYGISLAIYYPRLSQVRQVRTLKMWSRQLLAIFNINIQCTGQQVPRDEGGCLIVANHVSWLDIFVLNALHPSRFIAKSEVKDWPLIGWLCRRSGTIFIERAMRQTAQVINRDVSALLKQGISIGLFPEGTTTDGAQVGHFHSALIQPAIDAGASLLPVALRYRDEEGRLSTAAAFTGDMTLARSIWRILRCSRLDALVIFTPLLGGANMNRRLLARTAQQAIAQTLSDIPPMQPDPAMNPALPDALLSTQSAYVLLLDPVLRKH